MKPEIARVLVFAIASVVLAVLPTHAQPYPDTLWTRTYGGDYREHAESIAPTLDGGYVFAGWTSSFGIGTPDSSNAWLVKVNTNGDTLWTRTYGGVRSDYAYSVANTLDGGYVLAGQTDSWGAGSWDVYLVKTDSVGDTLWTRTYGGNGNDAAECIRQTYDLGYIIAGRTSSYGAGSDDAYVIKTDSLGDTLWTRTFGSTGPYDAAHSVKQTSDGGYVVAGSILPGGVGNINMYLVKLDSAGQTEWTRQYGGSSPDDAFDVEQTTDGGYIVAGYYHHCTQSMCGHDIYVVKTDSAGNAIWARRYGIEGITNEDAYAVEQTSDGGYIVAGYQTFGYCYVYVVRMDSLGDVVWSWTYDRSSYDWGLDLYRTLDGGFIISGWTGEYTGELRDALLVKLAPEPRMFLFAPDGGEDWEIWNTKNVEWYSPLIEDGIKIELNADYPSDNWMVLVDSTGNDGEELVTVPPTPSEVCRVRVSALQDTVFEVSDSNFTISTSDGFLALSPYSTPSDTLLSWDAGFVECLEIVNELCRLTNFGNETVSLYSINLTYGQNFTIPNDCWTPFDLLAGQTSTCYLNLIYESSGAGTHYDTLQIISDASNSVSGYVSIPLAGQSIVTPIAPGVVITVEGSDARLTWAPVTESINGCSVSVDAYLVFYSESDTLPYFYHGYTFDTTYVHLGVVRFSNDMFYQVVTYIGDLSRLDVLPGNPAAVLINRQETFRLLQESR